MKNRNVLIKNTTEIPNQDIFEYLAGFTTKLLPYIKVVVIKGSDDGYDTYVISKK